MTTPLVIPLIAGAMLLLALLMVSRMRLSTLATLFRFQAALLAFAAAYLAIQNHETQLLIIAVAVLILKVLFIPRFLLRVAHASGVSQRLESFLRPTLLTFVGIVLTGLVFTGVRAVFSEVPDLFFVSAASSLIFLGLLMLVSRKDMFSEAFGFLLMENGIFTFGLAVSGGMPLFVEIGILFDVLVLFMLVTVLVRRAQVEHRSVTTDYLRELID